MRAALLSAVVLASALFGGVALAQSATTLVVLIAEEPADPVTARLERDLRSLGLGVVVLAATPENSSSDSALERTARTLGGIAAVQILADAQGSKLWVFEPATNQTVTRALSRPATSSADPGELALGTLELLRASMVELHQPSESPPPTPALPREPAEHEPTHLATFSLSGGVAAELGLRSIGPSLGTLWAAWLRLGGCFGLRAFTALPLLAEQTDAPEGQVEVRPSLAGVGLSCGSSRGNAWLAPRVSLGFAGARIETRGSARAPLVSSSGAVWLAGGYGLLGVGLRLTHDVRLNFDATGVMLPTPAVIVANQREIGTWGAPGGVLSLSIEVLASR